jgi:hypothetical protein
MRGDASRQQRGGADDGRNSPIVTSNGQQQQSSPPPPNQPPNFDSSSSSSSLYPPTSTNGTSSSVLLPHGPTSSFSYSSILTSTPNAQIPSADSVGGGNGVHGGNHDRPFKYSKDEMLSIWKNNASRLKSAGIPLEFEKHEAFTSEDPLDPALLTEMTTAEKDVTHPLVEKWRC